MKKTIITVAAFDGMDSRRIRFLHEITKLGQLDVLLFSDAMIRELTHIKPKYSEPERRYFLESVRYVSNVHVVNDLSQLQQVSDLIGKPVDAWFTLDLEAFKGCEQLAQQQGIDYQLITAGTLTGYPEHDYDMDSSSDRKVIVTGCFDWFHTGHIRFFEEASEHGDLYVVLGHDKNILELKGPGHPMFPEQERKYLAGSIRFVKQALISSGDGWLDAEPEIQAIKPDGYVVNEDGDKDVKREYCEKNGIEYIVLKRVPKPGLKRRTSTDLRGF
jgi:cytidyltransferase-like protein